MTTDNDWTDEERHQFALCMGAPDMPDDNAVNYDAWIFHYAWKAALQTSKELMALLAEVETAEALEAAGVNDKPVGHLALQDIVILNQMGSVTATVFKLKRGINTVPFYAYPQPSSKKYTDKITRKQKGK
jgi:hypothetical protein